VTARCQPLRSARNDPTYDVQPVDTTIESRPRLVQPRLRRQQPHLVCRNIRSVGDQQVDTTAKRRGQWSVELTLVDLAVAADVVPSALNGGGVVVDGMQLDPVQGRTKRCAYCARAAAQVNNGGSVR
jgi:hypothetical protein